MKRFKHINVHSMEEALSTLGAHKEKAVLIAGGTDLLGVLKGEILPGFPELVINLKTIPGLDRIQEDDNGLRIGALTRLSHVAGSGIVKRSYPLLSEAAKSVGTPEIRNMGTLGGSLCQDSRCWYYRYPHQIGGRILCYRKGKGKCLAVKGDNRYHAILGGKVCFAVCPSDTAIALAALDAEARIAGPEGERSVSIREFYHTLGHVLGPEEILREVYIPKPAEHNVQRFIKFRLTESVDFAIVSVAVSAKLLKGTCHDPTIVLGAVAPTPLVAERAMDVIAGRPIDSETAAAAAEAAVAGAKPLSRNAYKVDLTRNLVRRAILSLANDR